ncbi:hypothetical protein OH76DRAFT_942878 [Lentinus brumalis]|uniref:Uncharacterized protein n=1 Tax=Lentinus brumalis TaxID=2498619 RepID=A0A371CZH9_9APHY|nr:hypothetical protein OH76DRAFT_942878 [Polyporus brumalis]
MHRDRRDGSNSSSVSGAPPSTSSAAPAPITSSTATAPDIMSSAAAIPSGWSHSPSPSPKPTAATTGIITSSVLVGIVAVAAAAIIYCIRRRKRRARREQGWTVDSESHGGGRSTKGGLPDGAHLARLPYESESASGPLSLVPDPYLVPRPPTSPDCQWRKDVPAPVPMPSQESIGSVGTTAQSSSSRLVIGGTPIFETPPGITYPAADASSEPVPREGPWATADGVLKWPRARGEDGRGGRGARDDGGSGSSRRREEDETAGLGQPVRAFAGSGSRGEGSEVGEELEGPPSYAAAVTACPYVPASS